MSMKSPVSTICLVACANRASVAVDRRDVEKSRQEKQQAAQRQKRHRRGHDCP